MFNIFLFFYRWSYLGLQGALLSLFIEPIYLSGLILGYDITARNKNEQKIAIERALQTRLKCFYDTNISEKFDNNKNISEKNNSISSDEQDKIKDEDRVKEISDQNQNKEKLIPTIPKIYCTNMSFKFCKSNADLINHNNSLKNSAEISIVKKITLKNTDKNNSDSKKSEKNISENIVDSSNSKSNSNKKSKIPIIKKIVPCGTNLNWIRDVKTDLNQKIGFNQKIDFNKNNDFNQCCDEIETQRKRFKCYENGTIEVTVAETGALQGRLISV